VDGIEHGLSAVGAGDAVTVKIDSFVHKRPPAGARYGSADQRGL
jgi:hypothetical protein